MNEHTDNARTEETGDFARLNRLRYADLGELPRPTQELPAWETTDFRTPCPVCGAEVIGVVSRRRHTEWHQSLEASR